MCELCNGKGWILTMNLNLLQWTIEKCDGVIFSPTTNQQEIKQMPNWCSNQATIHGTKKQILELVGAYERGGVIENYLPTPRDPDDQ